MVSITVTKAFTLSLAAGLKRAFAIGVHEVESEIAEHWYVKAHIDPSATKDVPAPAAEEAAGQVNDAAKDPAQEKKRRAKAQNEPIDPAPAAEEAAAAN